MFFKRFNINFQDFRIIKDTILNSLGYRLKVSVESIHLSTKKVNAIHKLYDIGTSGDFIIKKIFSILRDLELLLTHKEKNVVDNIIESIKIKGI